MYDIATKTDGISTLPASEFNNFISELKTIITSSGQTLSGASIEQIAKAISDYAGGGAFFTESGVANAYVLSVIGSKKAPSAYADGLMVRFRATNANTGASTVNLAGLGAKAIKLADGTTDISADAITTDKDTFLRYDNANGVFQLVEFSGAGGDSSSITVSQATHGFTVGDVLKYSGSAYAEAQANSLANAQAVGIVSEVPNVNSFTMIMGGLVTGLSSLVAGTLYYLDPSTAGAYTSTKPTTGGQRVKPIMVAISTTEAIFFNQIDLPVTEFTFVDGDLTAGVLTLNHALGKQYWNVAIIDNNDNAIAFPDDIDFTDANNMDIDLTSFGTLTGTWRVILS